MSMKFTFDDLYSYICSRHNELKLHKHRNTTLDKNMVGYICGIQMPDGRNAILKETLEQGTPKILGPVLHDPTADA